MRAINGATRPHEAAPGTIRGDFALETAQNIVHASDGPEAAEVELGLWFEADELLAYERASISGCSPPPSSAGRGRGSGRPFAGIASPAGGTRPPLR